MRLGVVKRRYFLLGFNPRTHVGCDWVKVDLLVYMVVFQSTHPCRMRPETAIEFTPPKSFNPRTHVGCDVLLVDIIKITYGFNPRTHVGCDCKFLL